MHTHTHVHKYTSWLAQLLLLIFCSRRGLRSYYATIFDILRKIRFVAFCAKTRENSKVPTICVCLWAHGAAGTRALGSYLT